MSTHFNLQSKQELPCHAQTPESCPLRADDGSPAPHFETREEAAAYRGKVLTEEYGTVPTQPVRWHVREGAQSGSRCVSPKCPTGTHFDSREEANAYAQEHYRPRYHIDGQGRVHEA